MAHIRHALHIVAILTTRCPIVLIIAIIVAIEKVMLILLLCGVHKFLLFSRLLLHHHLVGSQFYFLFCFLLHLFSKDTWRALIVINGFCVLLSKLCWLNLSNRLVSERLGVVNTFTLVVPLRLVLLHNGFFIRRIVEDVIILVLNILLDRSNTSYFMSYIDRVTTFVAQFWRLNHSSLLITKRFCHFNANVVAMVPASIGLCGFLVPSILILLILTSGTMLNCKWLLIMLLCYLDSNLASSSIYSCQYRCLRLVRALFIIGIGIIRCCIIRGGLLRRCDIIKVPRSVFLFLRLVLFLFIVVFIRPVFLIVIVWITTCIKIVLCVWKIAPLWLSPPVWEFFLLVTSDPWVIEDFNHRNSISFLILK